MSVCIMYVLFDVEKDGEIIFWRKFFFKKDCPFEFKILITFNLKELPMSKRKVYQRNGKWKGATTNDET